MRLILLVVLTVLISLPLGLAAQVEESGKEKPTAQYNHAPLVIDGRQLFILYGVAVVTAEERAKVLRDRILQFARDPSLDLAALTLQPVQDRTQLMVGDTLLMTVLDIDAELEGIDRAVLAEIYRSKIAEAVQSYRAERQPRYLALSAGYALMYLAALIGLLWLISKAFHWLEGRAEKGLHRNLKDIEAKSQRLVHAGKVWLVLAGMLRTLKLITFAVVTYLLATRMLELFPWTRFLSDELLKLFIDPLKQLGEGLVEATPGLIFILILFFILRFVLNLMKVFFQGVESGTVRVANFDPDWAIPTFKIARIVLIAFGIVIAYPYIPGSDSLAFKGISVFVGVLLSIGSSSVISNTFAGLSMIYRRAFKVDDWVRIDDVTGRVHEIRLQTTQIVTPKNESVVLPNSNIMNANVINYSHLARESGLILHTRLGIGYDTPWRQVEAMLLEAARRTEGVLEDPPPFVLHTHLADFSAEYQLNTYCAEPDHMHRIYSELHANIKDVFNENGVQIMSPAYRADPEHPKIVPPERIDPPLAKGKP